VPILIGLPKGEMIGMEIIIKIVPFEHAPHDWRLKFFNRLREFLDAADIKDYKIEIKESWPCIVSFKEA